MRRPILIWPLIFFLLLLAFGGIYGGLAMLVDPTGDLLQVADVLPLLPVPNFILPGLFLLTVMGLIPLLLAFALVVRPRWQWVDSLFKRFNYYWAWVATLLLVVVIAGWLIYEGWLIGFFPITYATAVIGLLIFCLL